MDSKIDWQFPGGESAVYRWQRPDMGFDIDFYRRVSACIGGKVLILTSMFMGIYRRSSAYIGGKVLILTLMFMGVYRRSSAV